MKLLFASDDSDMRIYRPADDRREEAREMRIRPEIREIMRKHGVTFGICTVLLLICMTGTICVKIAYGNGYSQAKEDLAEEYEARYRQQVQYYIDSEQAKRLLTGDASRQAAIKEDAELLAKVGAGVLKTYDSADLNDAVTVMQCVINRAINRTEFPSVGSISAAALQPEQWWSMSQDNSYTTELYSKALELTEAYYAGEAQLCGDGMVYASWNGSDIVLRNRWTADAGANYWRYQG